ncbi:hypothetical protein B0H13DRAFT_2322555 [Mycena leptocephala]|nr:hypothetical protein B0H13DRAFT_2322555 [Mycena leptocephala]
MPVACQLPVPSSNASLPQSSNTNLNFLAARAVMEGRLASSKAIASKRTAIAHPFEFTRWLQQHATSTQPPDPFGDALHIPGMWHLYRNSDGTWGPLGGIMDASRWITSLPRTPPPSRRASQRPWGFAGWPGARDPNWDGVPVPKLPARQSAGVGACERCGSRLGCPLSRIILRPCLRGESTVAACSTVGGVDGDHMDGDTGLTTLWFADGMQARLQLQVGARRVQLEHAVCRHRKEIRGLCALHRSAAEIARCQRALRAAVVMYKQFLETLNLEAPPRIPWTGIAPITPFTTSVNALLATVPYKGIIQGPPSSIDPSLRPTARVLVQRKTLSAAARINIITPPRKTTSAGPSRNKIARRSLTGAAASKKRRASTPDPSRTPPRGYWLGYLGDNQRRRSQSSAATHIVCRNRQGPPVAKEHAKPDHQCEICKNVSYVTLL